MSALYAKQLEWKKGSAQRAKGGTVDTGEELTFQPVFYTSKDTARKFKVTEKVGALTAVSGSAHVDRFKKASELKEEAHRRLYGTGVGGYPSKNKRAVGQLKGAYSYGGGAEEAAVSGREEGGDAMPPSYESHQPDGLSGYAVVHDPPHGRDASRSPNRHASSSSSSGSGGGGGRGDGFQQQQGFALPAHNAADDYAVVELLERERREWHLERVKLLQCVHLQQLELAARASAAQETAAAIAKEFANSIESYELRLLAVETGVQKELAEIKELLQKR